ncbi:MAG: hypothetical protein ACM3ML_17810, partial [Micromonosporaceae bacterium]
PGPATIGAGPASAANPHLRGPGPRQPVPGSAVGVAQGIAARWSAPGAPAPALNIPIEFRTVDYTATVFNPGTPDGFTAFITTQRTTLVTPASAATIDASNVASPRFATSADQAMWQAAGRPSLTRAPATGATQTIPAGQYTFLPQGSNLTYRQATALPAEPDRLAAAIADHLRPYAGVHPPASLELKQVAYLIATAPLTNEVRAAAWHVMASLPGLRICQNQPSQVQPGAIQLCIDSVGDQTVVNVNPNTGAVVTIADRLMQTSPAYPHVAAATIVGSSTFLTG